MRLNVNNPVFREVERDSQHGIQALKAWGPVLILWALFLVAVAYVAYVLDYDNYGWSVYDVYHRGGQAVLLEQSLYNGTDGWVYLYPPLLAQILAPLTQIMDLVAGQITWFVLNTVLVIGSVYLMQRYIPAAWARRLWIAPVLFVPIGQALYIGQVTIIMLALLTWAWVAVREGHHRFAGSLLALAVWIKVYPALLVVYFIWKRDWRILQGVVLTGAVLALVQIAVSGPEQFIAFFDVLFDLTEDGQPFATFENMSLFAFVSRLFQPNALVDPLIVNDVLFQVTRVVMTGGVLGLAALAVLRSNASLNEDNIDWRFDVEYALVLVTILILGSTLWLSGLPPLLLVYVLILRNRDQYRYPQLVKWTCIASFVLVSAYLGVVLLGSRVELPALVLSVGFFGVMLTWSLMVWLLVASGRPEARPHEPAEPSA